MATRKDEAMKPPLNIPLDDIEPNPDQPRKKLNPASITELAGTIKNHGILQPISVRRKKGKGDKYYIIFGERRWRASKEAGRTTIPAFVKDMTDEEVMEVQTIENLQREDLHPMDEAMNLARLKEKHSIAEISAIIHRNEAYISVRLRLMNLTNNFVKVFQDDQITFKQAKVLSKAAPELQNRIFKEHKEYFKKLAPGEIHEVCNLENQINQTERSLDKAPFDTEDATLNPKMGPCGTCPFNTSVNELFKDVEEPKCTNAPCYEKKTAKQFIHDAKKAQEEGMLLITTDSYFYGLKETYKRIADAEEISLLTPSQYNHAKKNDPGAVKAYVLIGDTGKREVYITLKVSAAKAKEMGITTEGNVDIPGMVMRAERGNELDAEKQWLDVRQLITGNGDNVGVAKKDVIGRYDVPLLDAPDLTQIERAAAINLIWQKCMHSKMRYEDKLLEALNIPKKDKGKLSGNDIRALLINSFREGKPELLNFMIRLFITTEGIPSNGSHITGDIQRTTYTFIKEKFPEQVTAIEEKYELKKTNRMKSLNKRIDALKPQEKPKKGKSKGEPVESPDTLREALEQVIDE